MTLEGNNIRLIRGDSESIGIKIADRGFIEGDKVEMMVRKSADDPKVYIHKAITCSGSEDDNFISYSVLGTSLLMGVIKIQPSDYLQNGTRMPFDEYVYDIQFTDANGSVTTIVPIAKFIVQQEVTYGN